MAVPRSRPLEVLPDQRQRGGEHRRPADALHGAGEVEDERRWSAIPQSSEATVKRAQRRPTKTRLRPKRSAERPAGQDQRGQREGVGGDHPLQVVKLEWRSRWILGSATCTMVTSTSSMNVAPRIAISFQRFARSVETCPFSTARRYRRRRRRTHGASAAERGAVAQLSGTSVSCMSPTLPSRAIRKLCVAPRGVT